MNKNLYTVEELLAKGLVPCFDGDLTTIIRKRYGDQYILLCHANKTYIFYRNNRGLLKDLGPITEGKDYIEHIAK